jgi:hypothetical protein
MNDQRNWVSLEIAGDKLNCSGAKVKSLIRAGRLQSKQDSFGGQIVSMCSIRSAAGQMNLRGVR